MIRYTSALVVLAFISLQGLPSRSTQTGHASDSLKVVKPVITTDTVAYDTDDPAIWINPKDTAQSLIVGTDKNVDGALYVFNLQGKVIPKKTIHGLKRPNNVDIAYGLSLKHKPTDIAVVTERLTHKLRIFRLPDMKPVDQGGIPVFEGEAGEAFRDLMGIALYKNPANQKIYAIVGRKSGPTEGYLWQYLLEDNGHGQVKATLVRKFGTYSGRKEIEAIAVDDALGYVYYSDERMGIRKYYADPAKGNEALALFGTNHFTADQEGISIYTVNDGTGYILVSDQEANHFNVYPREGTAQSPHQHPLIKVIATATQHSDGSDVTNASIPGMFRSGLFVAMSTDKTFQFYRWEDLAGKDLTIAPNGIPNASHHLK